MTKRNRDYAEMASGFWLGLWARTRSSLRGKPRKAAA